MKTIINKQTGEYVQYHNREFYTCTSPKFISNSATLEDLTNYAWNFDNVVIDTSNHEIIDLEVFREGELHDLIRYCFGNAQRSDSPSLTELIQEFKDGK